MKYKKKRSVRIFYWKLLWIPFVERQIERKRIWKSRLENGETWHKELFLTYGFERKRVSWNGHLVIWKSAPSATVTESLIPLAHIYSYFGSYTSSLQTSLSIIDCLVLTTAMAYRRARLPLRSGSRNPLILKKWVPFLLDFSVGLFSFSSVSATWDFRDDLQLN
jgi:hypothetical protein